MLDRKLADPIDRIVAKTVIQLLEITQYKNTELVVQTLASIVNPSRASDQTKQLLRESKSSLESLYNKEELDTKVKAYFKYVLEGYINGLLPQKVDQPVVEEKKSSRYDGTQTLFVKSLGSTRAVINAYSSNTIAQIKELIYTQTHDPVDSFRLLFAGREILDQHTLADYNIKNEDSVSMLLMIRGD